MATWRDLERAEPNLAASGRTLLFQHGAGLAYLATVRRDGGPRIHPVCPILAEGRLFGLIGRSPKRADLERDGRYALHATPDPDVDDEFAIAGWAVPQDDAALVARAHAEFSAVGGRSAGNERLFEFDIERALLATYEDGADAEDRPPVITTWAAPPVPADRPAPAAEVTGLDHVYVTVSDLARAEAFYDRVLRVLGFHKGDATVGSDPHRHYFTRTLAYAIRPARTAAAHDPYAPGLHHVCFQVATRADVDAAATALGQLGVEVTPPRMYPEYAPDYYALFLSDPDGIRLEVVARTQHRRDIVRHWRQFAVFLNPLADLARRG